MLARSESEQGWYNLLKTNTKEAMAWKGQFDAQYSAINEYVRGMGGIKEYVRLCAEYALQGGIEEGFSDALNEIHPNALMLIAKYGEEFQGLSWDACGAEPTPRACFGNARAQQSFFNRRRRSHKSSERMYYVEGIAFGARSEAVHHAWNSLSDFPGIAYDWTWHSVASWCLYCGLPFTLGEHNRLRKLAYPSGGFHLLLRRDVFPKLERTLNEILDARHEQQQHRLFEQVVVHDRDF